MRRCSAEAGAVQGKKMESSQKHKGEGTDGLVALKSTDRQLFEIAGDQGEPDI